jgi:hypothetical protein
MTNKKQTKTALSANMTPKYTIVVPRDVPVWNVLYPGCIGHSAVIIERWKVWVLINNRGSHKVYFTIDFGNCSHSVSSDEVEVIYEG